MMSRKASSRGLWAAPMPAAAGALAASSGQRSNPRKGICSAQFRYLIVTVLGDTLPWVRVSGTFWKFGGQREARKS